MSIHLRERDKQCHTTDTNRIKWDGNALQHKYTSTTMTVLTLVQKAKIDLLRLVIFYSISEDMRLILYFAIRVSVPEYCPNNRNTYYKANGTLDDLFPLAVTSTKCLYQQRNCIKFSESDCFCLLCQLAPNQGYWCHKHRKIGKRKVQGVSQSQTAALPRPQEEEETDKPKQAQTEQTYEKH